MWGTIIGVKKGDTWSSDYRSYRGITGEAIV